jgi:hypothetical protein
MRGFPDALFVQDLRTRDCRRGIAVYRRIAINAGGENASSVIATHWQRLRNADHILEGTPACNASLITIPLGKRFDGGAAWTKSKLNSTALQGFFGLEHGYSQSGFFS